MADRTEVQPEQSGTESLRNLLERNLTALMAKDKPGVLACFTDDAQFVDPHYPNERMHGIAEIAAGMDWVFSGMDSLGFTVIGWFSASDGRSGAAELDCNHVLAGGRELAFRQVLVVETDGELFTRVQAYEPYGPNGIGGFFMRMQNRRYRSRQRRAARRHTSDKLG